MASISTRRRDLRKLVLFLAMIVASFLATTAQAAPRDEISLVGRLCHFSASEPVNVATLAKRADLFACSKEQRHDASPYNWLRVDDLDVRSSAEAAWFLRFRNTYLYALNVAFVYDDGHISLIRAEADDLEAYATAGNAIAIRVPPRAVALKSVLVGVEGHPNTRVVMRMPSLISEAQLRRDAALNNAMFGALAGLLIAVIVFNLGFYTALHARYQLELVGMSSAFLLYLAIWSGVFEQLGFETTLGWRVGGGLIVLGAVAYSCVRFSLAFLERLAIYKPAAQAAQAFSVAAFIAALGLPSANWTMAGFFDQTFHIFCGLTVLSMIVLIGVALARGSAAARFLMIGLSPALIGALTRVVFALGWWPASTVGENFIFVGATGMTLMMSYAIANRVKEIQRAHDEQRRRHGELTVRAERDGLTGLLNRRTFIEQVEMRLTFDVGDRVPAFIILDLDHFKRVNDNLGHGVGDAVLKHTAEILSRTCRTGDIVGRLGGEEFGVLIAVREQREAAVAAERIRAAISTSAVHKIAPGLTHISASVGVASAGDRSCSWTDLYNRADRALYVAKEAGRNCVRFSEDEPGSSSQRAAA